MEFEIYPIRPKKIPKQIIPFISLTRFNEIRICFQARKLANIPQIALIEVAFNKDNRILRLKLVEENGHKMDRGVITIKGFFEYFNVKERGRFPTTFKDNTLWVDLKDTSLLKNRD